MFYLEIESFRIPFLLDTGATASTLDASVCSRYQFPLSDSKVCLSGLSAQTCEFPLTNALEVCYNSRVARSQFAVTPSLGVNLAGRDILCQLNLTVTCTDGGIRVAELQGLRAFWIFKPPQWWSLDITDFQPPIDTELPAAGFTPHVTLAYDSSGDSEILGALFTQYLNQSFAIRCFVHLDTTAGQALAVEVPSFLWQQLPKYQPTCHTLHQN